MRFDKVNIDGLEIRRMVHDSKNPKGFVSISDDDQEVRSDTNPGARELVLMRVTGEYESDDEFRYSVAFRQNSGELVRVPKTFSKRPDAEAFAMNLATILPYVLVLDVNHKVLKPKKTAEPDYEAIENEMHEEDRPRRGTWYTPLEPTRSSLVSIGSISETVTF